MEHDKNNNEEDEKTKLIRDKMEEESSDQHEGGGDCVPTPSTSKNQRSCSVVATNHRDASGFFTQVVQRRTNIYSTKPVPLKSPWSFWIDRANNGMSVQDFARNLHHIYTVYSVHEFWRVLCNIPLPTSLDYHSSLHFTREERMPIWEEAYNSRGGTFRFRVSKKDTDKVWRELLMSTAAEHWFHFVDGADDIVGITVSIREREDLFMIWNLDSSLAKVARVFDCVRLILPDTFFVGEFYKPHTNHHAFEKRLAVAAATSQEGIIDMLKHHRSGDGSGGGFYSAGGSRSSTGRRHPRSGQSEPYGRQQH